MFQSCFLSAHGYAGPTTTKYKVITVAWASSYVSTDPPENAVDNIAYSRPFLSDPSDSRPWLALDLLIPAEVLGVVIEEV